MAVLGCSAGCSSKVESNRCCGSTMGLKSETLLCNSCGKEVAVNQCCGAPMKELKT